MADLGNIGALSAVTIQVPFQTAYARNITNNPIVCSLGKDAHPQREDWKTLSGFIRNNLLAGISRRYTVIQRDDPAEVGYGTSSTDGSFTCRVPSNNPVFLVAFDSGSDNAIILDNVIPI